MKTISLLLLLPFLGLSQIQIGNTIDGPSPYFGQGYRVSLSAEGDVVAAGNYKYVASGIDNFFHVYVYKNISGVWTQIGNQIDGNLSDSIATANVSLSSDGSIVAIGIPFSDSYGTDSGNVKIYKNVTGVWTQIGADIIGEAPEDQSGYSISLSSDGTIVAIGAPENDGFGNNSGHVRIYKNVLGTWTQIGSDINGLSPDDRFGKSVSLSSDGSIVAIGAPNNDTVGLNSGHVLIYKNVSGVWTQIGNTIDGQSNEDCFGWSVSLSSDGTILAIGAAYSGIGGIFGEASVYQNISGVWTQIGNTIIGASGDSLGNTISLSSEGLIVAIGSLMPTNSTNPYQGRVQIYKNTLGTWTKVGDDINGEGSFTLFSSGISLSSDGRKIAIGAPGHGGSDGSEKVKIYDLSSVLNSNSFVDSNFSVYPNPANDILNINLNNILILENVNIYSTSGQLLKTEKVNSFKINNLSTGTYFVEVQTNKGKATKTIVVK